MAYDVEEIAQAWSQADSWRGIFEMLPIGILLADSDAQVSFYNHAAEHILGTGDASRGGPSQWTPVFGWFLPDKITLLAPDELPLPRILRGAQLRDELLFVRSAYRPCGFWIRVSGGRVQDESQRRAGAVMVLRDVTEGRVSEQIQALLSHVVEQIADGVLITDKQGFIEYVNPAFESMTGFSQDDVRGRTPRILKSGLQDAAFYQRVWNGLLSGHVFQGTMVDRKKTGEICHLEETITPVTDEAGNLTHFVAVMQDITEALNRQEREVQLRLARQIQQRFYVPAPAVPGFDVAAAAYPAYETSGDYFDFIALPRGRLTIAVGDVEGHGFGSALVMALTRAYVRSFAAMDLEVDQILTHVNRMLVNDLGDGCFVTLILTCLDPVNHSLVYASAGHVPGYVLDSSGNLQHTLESSGLPLGLFPQVRYARSRNLPIHPGDLLALLTDGVTESEAPDGTPWGGKGVLQYLSAYQKLRASELVEGLYQEARRRACDEVQKDDITAVIVKAEPTTQSIPQDF